MKAVSLPLDVEGILAAVDCGSDAGGIGQFVLLGQRESFAAIDFRGELDFELGNPKNSLGSFLGGRIVMTCEQARQYLWREPFQPVRIRLKDGRTFDIRYERWTMAAEAILIIGIPPADDPNSRLPDRGIWVQWPDVDAIEPLSDPAAPAV